MKILFILDVYKPHIGWVEILFENIISRLEKQWIEIVILTSRFSKDIPSYEKISKNIEIFRVGSNRYNFMFFSLFTWVKLAKDVDLIHTTTYNSAIPSYFIWKLTKKEVVITVHEIFGHLWNTFMWWKGSFFWSFENFIFKFSFEKYICVSNATNVSLQRAYTFPQGKLVTIHNGIDYNIWKKEKYKEYEAVRQKHNLNNDYIGLYFWRPWISKWLEFYIRAIPYIIKHIPNFQALLIVPENDKERTAYIKQLISELLLEKYITWIPWVERSVLWDYILAADFVIVPSLAEGFWFAAAEVCALEQQLLVSSAWSLPEVVSGKINFFEPGSIQGIVEGVIKFHKGSYEEIPRKEFSWENNIDSTLDIYKEIIWKKG